MNRFIKFCIVGGLAFILDAGILTLAIKFGLSPISGRGISFMVATFFTWICNRTFTFRVAKSDSLFKELLRYLGVNILAFSINWLVYIFAINTLTIMYQIPALALIPATAVSMLFNYCGMKKYAFRVGR